jgi:hypothetical protein
MEEQAGTGELLLPPRRRRINARQNEFLNLVVAAIDMVYVQLMDVPCARIAVLIQSTRRRSPTCRLQRSHVCSVHVPRCRKEITRCLLRTAPSLKAQSHFIVALAKKNCSKSCYKL